MPTVDRSFSDWAIVGGSESTMMYGCECTVPHTLYIQLVSSCVSFPIRAHCWNRPRLTGKRQCFSVSSCHDDLNLLSLSVSFSLLPLFQPRGGVFQGDGWRRAPTGHKATFDL